MKIYTYLLLSLLTFAFTSCDDTEAGGTSVEEMAGDWWVTSTPNGGTTSPYFLINTYNTAANLDTEMWIEIPNAFDVIVGQCTFRDLCVVERFTGNTNAMFFRTENTHFSQRVEQFTVDLDIGYEHMV